MSGSISEGDDGVEGILERVIGPSSSHLLRSACSSLMSLIESASPEGGLLIYMFGLRLGERIGKALGEVGHNVDPWSAVERVSSHLGMAEGVKVLEEGPEGFLVSVSGTGEDRRSGKEGMERCNFMRGFIAGMLSVLTDQLVLVGEPDRDGGEGGCLLRVVSGRRGGGGVVISSTARRAIVEYLRVNPGAYLRQMARDLGMSLGSLRWHLNVLERSGLVWERRRGNLTEFYLSDII